MGLDAAFLNPCIVQINVLSSPLPLEQSPDLLQTSEEVLGESLFIKGFGPQMILHLPGNMPNGSLMSPENSAFQVVLEDPKFTRHTKPSRIIGLHFDRVRGSDTVFVYINS